MEHKEKRGAGSGIRFVIQQAAVLFQNSLEDIKAQAAAALGACSRRVALEKFPEQFGTVFFRNHFAAIIHRDAHIIAGLDQA